MGRLIIDGNQVYEIDEACMKKKKCEERIKMEQKKSAVGRELNTREGKRKEFPG